MKSKSPPDLSIVIPALREEKRIGKTLDGLAAYLRKDRLLQKLNIEVLVVTAEGGDKTDQVSLSKKSKFNNLILLKPGSKVGKGRDVAYGMLRAKGKTIIFMDADTATPLWHISEFYEKQTQDKTDVLIGTRNLMKHHPDFLRRAVSSVGNILFHIMGGVWVEDSQCGFKMFTKDAARLCFSKLTIQGWGFDMEVLAIAKAQKMTIKTVRIDDWISVPDGTFVDNVFSGSLKSLFELCKIMINRITGKYQ